MKPSLLAPKNKYPKNPLQKDFDRRERWRQIFTEQAELKNKQCKNDMAMPFSGYHEKTHGQTEQKKS